MPDVDVVAEARRAAAGAGDLEALHGALDRFPHCELKLGAQNLVFADGDPAARVMVIGEAPVGMRIAKAGRLSDAQVSFWIGCSMPSGWGARCKARRGLYITNIMPWRPPQNRDPSPEEIAMMRPFMDRHIELAAPEIIVLMGNISCQAMLGRRGITRLRGQWQEAASLPVLPMFHPAYLCAIPVPSGEAWADLLSLKARLT